MTTPPEGFFDDVGTKPANAPTTTVPPPASAGYFDDVGAIPYVPVDPPAAVTGLTATPGNGQVTLSWDASTGATGYSVTYTTSDDGFHDQWTDSFGSVKTLVHIITATSLVFAGLDNDVEGTFTVVAFNAAGDSAPTAVTATPAAGPTDGGDDGGSPVPGDTGSGPGSGTGGATVAPLLHGDLQAMYLLDDSGSVTVDDPNAPRYQITPSLGAVYYTDFDKSFYDLREVVTNYPNRSGTFDETDKHGARAMTVALLIRGWNDQTGTYRAASWHYAQLAKWARVGRIFKLVWEERDLPVMQAEVRIKNLSAPLVLGQPGYLKCQLQVVVPDGVFYERPTAEHRYSGDPNYFGASVSAADVTAAGLELTSDGVELLADGLELAGLAVDPGQLEIGYDGDEAYAPILRARAGSGMSDPKFRIVGNTGQRAKIEFTGLDLLADDTLTVDVQNRTAQWFHAASAATSNAYGYLQAPTEWEDFLLQPGDRNLVQFYPDSTSDTATVEVGWRVPHI